MSRYELFSKRNNPVEYDVYVYDSIPEKLRHQIYYIWKDVLEIEHAFIYNEGHAGQTFERIHDIVCREHGFEKLVGTNGRFVSYAKLCEHFLKNSSDYEVKTLFDLIEVSMREIDYLHRRSAGAKISKQEAVDELNRRFKENGVGYEFSNEILIRKDSEILHEEIVKPALYLLKAEGFDGALEEFLKAHDHYRKGNYGDSILNAGKAFESTMKTIGTKEAWGLTGKENASDLINLLISHQVIPGYLQNSLIGLGTVRNKVAGHGQGAAPVAVPEYFVNYALHLCGTNIVMLIEAYKEFSK